MFSDIFTNATLFHFKSYLCVSKCGAERAARSPSQTCLSYFFRSNFWRLATEKKLSTETLVCRTKFSIHVVTFLIFKDNFKFKVEIFTPNFNNDRSCREVLQRMITGLCLFLSLFILQILELEVVLKVRILSLGIYCKLEANSRDTKSKRNALFKKCRI